MAQEYDDSQHRRTAATAEAAIVDLLIDTPTAQQLEAEGTPHTLPTTHQQTHLQPGGSSTSALPSTTAAALQASTQLRNIAGELLRRREPVVIPYAMVAPHVEALICWFRTLEQGDVGVHIQLPPILMPLREILCDILEGRPGGPELWAKLVAVAEALEALLMGNTLAHPADVVMLSEGGDQQHFTARSCHPGLVQSSGNLARAATRCEEVAATSLANRPRSCYELGAGDRSSNPRGDHGRQRGVAT